MADADSSAEAEQKPAFSYELEDKMNHQDNEQGKKIKLMETGDKVAQNEGGDQVSSGRSLPPRKNRRKSFHAAATHSVQTIVEVERQKSDKVTTNFTEALGELTSPPKTAGPEEDNNANDSDSDSPHASGPDYGEEDWEEEWEEDEERVICPILDPAPISRTKILKRYQRLESLLRVARESGTFHLFMPPKIVSPPVPEGGGEGPEEDVTALQLRLAAKQRVWERMSCVKLLTQEEMMTFYGVLVKYGDKVPEGLSPRWFRAKEAKLREEGKLTCDKYISAQAFIRARLEMDRRIASWLTMEHFYVFRCDSDDTTFRRVPIIHFFNYVMKKVWLTQTRLGFMNYDQVGEGYLTEEWLESYIRELLPTLVQLEGLEEALEPFLLCAATRKFFFFMDPNRIGKVKVVDILASMLLDEILELRDLDVKDTNWFSKQNILRVYEHYIHLDVDANGMLSTDEFTKFNFSTNGVPIRLTRSFINALFAAKMTFRGEMDFRSYVDFVLAMENKKELASIAYFFRVLDQGSKGHLNSFDLHYFYKDVYKMLVQHNPDTPKFDDVKDEIFDMIKPKDPLLIKMADLAACGKGDLVISMLIDAKGFDEYENREFIVVNNSSSKPKPPPAATPS